MMSTFRPDALDDVSPDAFIRIYEHLTRYDFSTAKKMTRKDFAVVCPLHNDTHASMSFDPEGRQWFCQVCRVGGGVADMVIEFRAPSFVTNGLTRKEQRADAFRWLRANGYTRVDPVEAAFAERFGSRYGTSDAPHRVDLKEIPNPKASSKSGHVKLTKTKRHVFPYDGRDGAVSYEVVRIDGINAEGKRDKIIYKRRPLPAGGTWVATLTTWSYIGPDGDVCGTVPLNDEKGKKRRKPSSAHLPGIGDAERVLYRLQDVHAAAIRGDLIIVVEGEKKAENLRKRTGLCVTTWADGANSELQPSWLRDVAGARRLWVLGDSDPYREDSAGRVRSEGRDAARRRAEFFRTVVFNVRALDLFPDREDKSDVDDWLTERPDATPEQLIAELEAIAATSEPIE